MKPKPLPPLAVVISRLKYNPVSGNFTWASRKNSLSRIKVGDIAGRTTTSGYITIKLNGYEYPAHRLAWLIMTGEDPDKTVDHKNKVKTDNRWCNLRLATNKQQSQNRNIRGYTKTKYGKFRVNIKIKGKAFYCGSFESEEHAAVVYWLLAKHFFQEFACSNANQFWLSLDESQQEELRKAAEAAKVNIERLIPEDQEKQLATVPAGA